MPNGIDKNYMRLRAACGAYRQRFDDWPGEARLCPIILWDLAHLFDSDQFQTLSTRVRLCTRDKGGFSVGGPKGVLDYEQIRHDELDDEFLELAGKWLGVVPRHE